MPGGGGGGGGSVDAQGQGTLSTTVGLLYVFNIIIGTGALALPRAVQTAGYLLGTALLICSALMSYVCATFVIESMAIANAALKLKGGGGSLTEDDDSSGSDSPPVENGVHVGSSFTITRRVEVGEMSSLFLGRVAVLFAYASLAVYLFGDLAIYSSTVPKSLMNVICSSVNASHPIDPRLVPCHPGEGPLSFSRYTVYRICILLFVAFCLPMVLLGVTKTKWLQIFTTASRWTAFTLMIVLASIQLVQNGPQASPPAANLEGFGSIFGVAVYAFMCHHSLPGLITPIANKSFINQKLIIIYTVILLFYCALSITGAFTFSHVRDIYTLNFLHDSNTGSFYLIMDLFLALFPVFALTSSSIIVAITLTNNLRVLIGMLRTPTSATSTDEGEALLSPNNIDSGHQLEEDLTSSASSAAPPSPINIQPSMAIPTPTLPLPLLLLPVLVVLLPALISFFTDNVLTLASLTGSYPGVAVQYLIPAGLAIGARGYAKRVLRRELPKEGAGPFSHWIFPWIAIGWSALAIIIVSSNLIGAR